MNLSTRSHSLLTAFICFLLISLASAQPTITDDIVNENTSIKNQQKTGTCWSFATGSFLESELHRMGSGDYDLSEMFTVRQIYIDKARNYLLRQGKANFSQGSLAHDLFRVIQAKGMMPESAYTGRLSPNEPYNHSELVAGLKGYLDGVRKQDKLSDRWQAGVEALLDVYLGPVKETFTYHGRTYDPKSFAEASGLQVDNYRFLTSFTHHPFGSSFILEIPDNYSNGSYDNVSISDLTAITDRALAKGYTVAWDGDVSESGFSAKTGIAKLPESLESSLTDDQAIQDLRQATFMSYETTDDHLMHIVGTAQDDDGNRYYKVKNSWGDVGPYGGYLYMTVPYFKLKTVAIAVHQDVVN